MISADDSWAVAGTGEPAFGAGYTLPASLQDTLSAREGWMRGLEQAGYTLALYDNLLRLYRLRPMAEILGEATP